MKKVLLVLAISLLLTVPSFSQFDAGESELGGSLGLGSTTYESTYRNFSSSSSYNFFMLSMLYSYYVIGGFSLEPHLIFYAIEKSNPTFLFLLNLSYTLTIPSFFLFPYGMIGYGLSNGMSNNMPYMLFRNSDKFDIGLLNIGAGVKTMIGNSGIIRAELNYRSFNKSDSEGNFNASYKHNIISILIGFSLLLK